LPVMPEATHLHLDARIDPAIVHGLRRHAIAVIIATAAGIFPLPS